MITLLARLQAAMDDPEAQTLGVYLTAETVSRLLNVADAAEAFVEADPFHPEGMHVGKAERLSEAVAALRRLDAAGVEE